jgi:hypothetical protein
VHSIIDVHHHWMPCALDFFQAVNQNVTAIVELGRGGVVHLEPLGSGCRMRKGRVAVRAVIINTTDAMRP